MPTAVSRTRVEPLSELEKIKKASNDAGIAFTNAHLEPLRSCVIAKQAISATASIENEAAIAKANVAIGMS